jgi:hypothetical protein
LYYEFDELGDNVREAIYRLLRALYNANRVWSVKRRHHHGDWKRNAGAHNSVTRSIVDVGWGPPPTVKTNVEIGYLSFTDARLYFLPDRVLLLKSGQLRSLSYSELQFSHDWVGFIEEEAVPRDATVTGTTWRFVNKDGGPDLRFNNNRKLPVVRYGLLTIGASQGLELELQLSTAGLAEGACKMLELVQRAIEELRTKPPPPRQKMAEVLSLIGTSARPASGLMETGGSHRDPYPVATPAWLPDAPEWVAPALCGLILALPIVAFLVRWNVGSRPEANAFAILAALVFAVGASYLCWNSIVRLRAKWKRMRVDRLSGFRAVLLAELRAKPIDQVDFGELVHASGTDPKDAFDVGKEVYRMLVDRSLADGEISGTERRRLNRLASCLSIDDASLAELESQAASACYERAKTNALADGVLTIAEEQALTELRASLGLTH